MRITAKAGSSCCKAPDERWLGDVARGVRAEVWLIRDGRLIEVRFDIRWSTVVAAAIPQVFDLCGLATDGFACLGGKNSAGSAEVETYHFAPKWIDWATIVRSMPEAGGVKKSGADLGQVGRQLWAEPAAAVVNGS